MYPYEHPISNLSVVLVFLCIKSMSARSAFGWYCPLWSLTQYNITASVKKPYEERLVSAPIHHPDTQTTGDSAVV